MALSKKEKDILTLMDSSFVNGFLEFAQKFVEYTKEDIGKISKKLIKKGYVKIITIPQGNSKIKWHFHTEKVKPEMLNDNIRYEKDYGKFSISPVIGKIHKVFRDFQKDKSKKSLHIKLTKSDEKLLELEEKLKERIRKFILGKKVDLDSLNFELQLFFNSKRQEHIDLLNPTNIRLFTTAQKILENFKDTEIERANLDYIYSYKTVPLKYCWKSSNFNIRKNSEKIKNIITKILEKRDFSKKDKKEMLDFIEWVIREVKEKSADWSLFEEFGITNKKKDVFIYVDASIIYDEYRHEEDPDLNILVVTNKKNKGILKLLPNNKGTIYANLIFK